jgi:asparagine synthase (glutamine-hydrolysing)
MCGIAGILIQGSGQVDPEDLRALASALSHRGPDGEGLWRSPDGRVGLVHRRLAIIDTSAAGDQPMHSADGRYSIVYNGEVFNFLELRLELEALGMIFHSESDTEVVLQAWCQWGAGMLERFNGMWAIAIVDHETQETFLARDRFGIKPLHYAHDARRFAFASELRALRALPGVSSEVDPQVARRLLFDPFSIEASERTLFSAVRRLPAGHCATLSAGQLTVRRWWRTVDHLPEVPSKFEEAVVRWRELFDDAVRLRMRSDVPIGTCLSGGFDSSAIVCAMAAVADGRPAQLHDARDWRHAFVATFPGQPNDETPEAREAAAFAGIDPHLMPVDERDATADIDSILADLDDVYISLPTAPWLIYRELRRNGLTVSLDGHGADELMGAYRQQGDGLGYKLRNLVARFAATPAGAAAVDAAKSAWLSAKGLNFMRGHRFSAPAPLGLPSDADPLPREWGPLNQRLYRMFHATVLPTILRNFDRLSMAHGIEVRMPFMDWRLVTFTMALPDAWKSSQGYGKWIARQALSGRMPERIRMNRRKVGFNSPMPGWLNGPLRAWAESILVQPNPDYDALVDRPALIARVQALGASGGWDWQSVGRLWPYLHLKWVMDRQLSPSSGQSGAR